MSALLQPPGAARSARRRPPRAGAAQTLHVHLLGGFRIAAGEDALEDRTWRLRKAAALVKLLCLSPGRRLQRDRLLEELWPDLTPEAAANNLHYTLHVARRTLEAAFPLAGRTLHARAGVVELQPNCPVVVDVEAFEAAAGVADGSADPDAYGEAIRLYGGDLLPEDAYEDWAAGRREFLRDRYHALLREKGRLHERRGELALAIQAMQLALANEPASEDAHSALMRLYALGGQREQALRQFQQLREALRRELDAEPDPSTQRLYEDILSGRLAATPVPAAPTAPQTAPASPPRRHNIPYALTSFVGRRRELAELPTLLAEHRLVTLVGTGGCGKTRLALEVAQSMADGIDGGAWLVELAAVQDGRQIAHAAAAAVGVVEEVAHTLMETLCRHLGAHELLLILDNCEHVAADAAAFTDSLLRAAPMLRVLATSREPLGIVGEIVRRVPSLGLPPPIEDAALAAAELLGQSDEREDLEPLEDAEESEAVRLFLDRARRVRPAFRLDARNAAAIAQICRRLDGMPLAIELAAARVDALAPRGIADRLDDCFRLLTGGGRTAPPRHQTLRAAVSWSYVLLSEDERALFDRLSIFAGAFSLDAAEHVCGPDLASEPESDVLDLLTKLVSKSLVAIASPGSEGEPTYRLLEPLRQYATERLSETDRDDDVARRHAAYYTSVAEEAEEGLAGPHQLVWLERLEAEQDNLRAALAWALAAPDARDAALACRAAGALARFWHVRGRVEEGQRWLERAVARGDALAELDGLTRGKLLAEAGNMASVRADYDRAAELHQDALRIRREAGDPGAIGWSLISLGNLAYARGHYAAARPLYEEALDSLRDAGDQRGIATAYGNLAYVERNLENYVYAEALCGQSLQLYEALGDRRCVSLTYAALGYVARGRGDHLAARGHYAQSLELAQALGARRDMAAALEGIAAALGALGCAETAAALFGGADALRSASGAPRADADHEEYEQAVCTLRDALGEPAWRDGWRKGVALSLESIVDLALSTQAPEGTPAPQLRGLSLSDVAAASAPSASQPSTL